MVKIDTKEHFRIFYLSGSEMTENMSGEIKNLLLEKCEEQPGNAIVDTSKLTEFPTSFINVLKELQAFYSDHRQSFFVTPVSESPLKEHPSLAELNHTSTLREAIDMVMLEKLERELSDPDPDE